MISAIVQQIKTALKNATVNKEHCYRYCTLSTIDNVGSPIMRTVVLRAIDDQLNLTIYTDSRSKKTTHIQQQNKVGLLFFDRQNFVQISIQAKAEIITDTKILERLWKEIPEQSRKDYCTTEAPGSILQNPEDLKYSKEGYFFAAIKFVPYEIEYLKIGRSNHVRIQFQKQDKQWKETHLVP